MISLMIKFIEPLFKWGHGNILVRTGSQYGSFGAIGDLLEVIYVPLPERCGARAILVLCGGLMPRRYASLPKLIVQSFVSQFHPTYLCNVDYKLLTKIVSNRLKPHLPNIVSPFQTGFIPTRSIHENIIVARERLHSMRKMKGRNDFFAINAGLSSIKCLWKWVCQLNWWTFTMHCVISVSSNVMWNGSHSNYFNLERSIRQGDPLSPFQWTRFVILSLKWWRESIGFL